MPSLTLSSQSATPLPSPPETFLELRTAIKDLADDASSQRRRRLLYPETLIPAMLQAVFTKQFSLSGILLCLNNQRAKINDKPTSLNTGALSRAISKISPSLIQNLNKLISAKIQHLTASQGMGLTKVYHIDGTTFSTDLTPENQNTFGKLKDKEECGYPLLRALAVQDAQTKELVAFNVAPCTGKGTGEMSLASHALECFDQGSMVIGDRYYPSFFFMAKLIEKQVNGLFQSHRSRHVDFRQGERLGVLDHIVEWEKPSQKPGWMAQSDYDSCPETLRLREVCINKEAKPEERVVLTTTLLGKEEYPVEKLKRLFKGRWGIETSFRDLKKALGLEHIKGKTPESVERTLLIYILSYNFLRLQMLQSEHQKKSEKQKKEVVLN